MASRERYERCVGHLKEEFGKRLVCEIDANVSVRSGEPGRGFARAGALRRGFEPSDGFVA